MHVALKVSSFAVILLAFFSVAIYWFHQHLQLSCYTFFFAGSSFCGLQVVQAEKVHNRDQIIRISTAS